MFIELGIDVDTINEKIRSINVQEMIQSLKEKYKGFKVIIGRDKYDSTKGIRQKLLSYERFLEQYPEYQGKIVLFQVVLHSTNENESNVSELVSRINSRFGTIEYQPITCLHQDISYSHYLALLSVS
jgi:trehalose-6-phosphate synthase